MYHKLGELVDPFDQACIIVSALAHDVGHPGYNNGFMVNTFSKQSLLCKS